MISEQQRVVIAGYPYNGTGTVVATSSDDLVMVMPDALANGTPNHAGRAYWYPAGRITPVDYTPEYFAGTPHRFGIEFDTADGDTGFVADQPAHSVTDAAHAINHAYGHIVAADAAGTRTYRVTPPAGPVVTVSVVR